MRVPRSARVMDSLNRNRRHRRCCTLSMDGNAKRYREEAERLRKEAEAMKHESVRRQLLTIAADYEALAETVEKIGVGRND